MITQKQQGVKQRVGKLIEEYIIENKQLLPNKRQQSRGYYDAYNKINVFEIKAVKAIRKQDTRVIIDKKNHVELLSSGRGKYVVVKYDLVDKDKNLQLIQDINILQTVIISVEDMAILISKYGTFYDRNFKGHIKQYIRIKFNYLREVPE